MQKEKNKKIFLKKKIRKKSFLIRKHASINNYNASFNASKNFFKLFNITSKDIVGCYWPINNELDLFKVLENYKPGEKVQVQVKRIKPEEGRVDTITLTCKLTSSS